MPERLGSLLDCLYDPAFIKQHRTVETAFTRCRKLPFHLLICFLLNQVKGAIQREVDDFFVHTLGLKAGDSVSTAAVSYARIGLPARVFTSLNARLLDSVIDLLPSHFWHGFRVMAVDGSVLNLPRTPALFEAFGGQNSAGVKLPMARYSQLLDVGSGFSWHTCMEPYVVGEGVCAAEHLTHAPRDALVLYDRGYPSFFLFAWHRQHERAFCARIKRNFSPETDALFADPKAPRPFLLAPCAKARALCEEHGVAAQPLRVRAVRVILSTGETEILLTSLLDEARYPDAEFGALYALRWGVESDFRVQKSRLEVENFTGIRPESLRQDVYARVLVKNIAMLLNALVQQRLDAEREAQKRRDPASVPKFRKCPNVTDLLHLCKFVLVAFLLNPPTGCLQPILDQLRRHTHAERPGRTTPRTKKSGKSKKYPMSYKQTA